MTNLAAPEATGAIRLAERIESANTWKERTRGLIGRSLTADEGLYIAPCSSIHTFFMPGPIDAVFLDAEGEALALYHSLPPWRATRWISGAAGVLELAPGTLERSGIQLGQKVDVSSNGRDDPAPRGRTGRWTVNILLGAFWFYLASQTLPGLMGGEISSSGFMLFAVNTLIGFLFLLRREGHRVSESIRDRLITLLCVLLSFSLRPAAGASVLSPALGTGLMTLSLVLVFAAYLSLGRSFGLIPADRGVKIGGLYHWVRHPLYGAEMSFFGLFLLMNLTVFNALLVMGVYLSLHLRARAEERFLSLNGAYRDYCLRVKRRYVPFLV